MSLPTTRHSYRDCYDILDMAIADPEGVRVRLASYEDAMHYRLRLHKARSIDREENMKAFPEDHPMYGSSQYDVVKCTIEGEWVYIRPRGTEVMAVESLSGGKVKETPRITFGPVSLPAPEEGADGLEVEEEEDGDVVEGEVLPPEPNGWRRR